MLLRMLARRVWSGSDSRGPRAVSSTRPPIGESQGKPVYKRLKSWHWRRVRHFDVRARLFELPCPHSLAIVRIRSLSALDLL